MNLFAGNLSIETTERDLQQLFSEFGEILSVKVVKDNETGISRGFGFVEMADRFEAFDAIDNLDSTFFLGHIITVKEAKPKQGGGGFNNNRGGGGFNRGGSGGGQHSRGQSGFTPKRNFNDRRY